MPLTDTGEKSREWSRNDQPEKHRDEPSARIPATKDDGQVAQAGAKSQDQAEEEFSHIGPTSPQSSRSVRDTDQA